MISLQRVDHDTFPNLREYQYKVIDEYGCSLYCYDYTEALTLLNSITDEFEENEFMRGGRDARDGRGRELNQTLSYDRGYWAATEMDEVLEAMK